MTTLKSFFLASLIVLATTGAAQAASTGTSCTGPALTAAPVVGSVTGLFWIDWSAILDVFTR